uniref:Uncharacterized protein n=1 Tax=Oryza punctata TaxID=4537 RepID=A0A0E0M0W9_ORYPU
MPVMDGLLAQRLLSTDSSNQKMNPSSDDCAKRMITSKDQFSKNDSKGFNRYWGERTKRAEMNMLLSFEKYGDACESRSSLLRDIKAMLEARNKRSAQKFLLVKQWAVLIFYSSAFGFALYNLHL